MRTTVFAACGAVLALTLPSAAAVAAEEASARFIDREREEIGEARLTEGPRGVLIQLQIEGLPAGPHGLHLHANGTCEDHDEGFQASGSHINPEERPHGLLNPDGPDHGDLPNIGGAGDRIACAVVQAAS